MEYFIIDENNKQAGPFSLEQLAQKAITPETLVWAQGMKDWTPAWKVAELKTTLEAAEAIRANQAQQGQNVPPVNPQNSQQGFQPGYQQTQPGYQQAQQGTYQQDQQTAYQQAQQAAYQQGFQQGASMHNQGNRYQPEEPRKKKSGKTLWKFILGLIVFIILLFAVTNPSAEAHKEKVSTEVGKMVEKATATTDNNFFTQGIRSIAKMMADNFMGQAMDQLFEYHNYIICSKGTVTFDGKEHTVSFGILGKVYTMNADDMMKALKDGGNIDIEESTSTSDGPDVIDDNSASSSSDDNSAMDESGDDNASNGVDGLGARVQKKLEDKANEAMDKAADKVSKKVEEKINQKLNQPIDSSKIEKVIDKILELL